LPVPEILVKTVPEHVLPPIFGNKKKFPFSSRISNFCLKEKFETRKGKKETWTDEQMDGQTDGRTDGRPKERYTDRQADIEREGEREREREGGEREREINFSDFPESENIFSGTNFSSRNSGSKLNTSRSRSRNREREN
jgi:hypothetical protein